MVEVSSHAPGNFCWIHLATTDAAASKDFYAQLMGWTYTDAPAGPDMVYTMAQKDGKNVVGLYEMDAGMREQGIPPHWESFIAVADVDAAVERVKAVGGSLIQEPFDVFDAGRTAVAVDPTGAVFALWQPKEHIGAQLVYQPGAMGWNELYTYQTAPASQFYADFLGWTATLERVGPEQQEYTVFKNGEQPVAGMMQIKPEWGEVPPNWSIYLGVDDCDASLQQAVSLGAEVIVPVTQEVNIRFAFIKDPQGVYLGIAQVTAE